MTILSILISALSLAFSIFIYFKNKKNTEQIEAYRKDLYKLKVEREEEEKIKRNKANLIAKIRKTEEHYYSVDIKNIGESIAKNVKAEILINKEDERLFDNLEIFPINIESQTEIGIGFVRTINFPRKFKIRVQWQDKNKEENEREIELTP